jgi:hypothetical protein
MCLPADLLAHGGALIFVDIHRAQVPTKLDPGFLKIVKRTGTGTHSRAVRSKTSVADPHHFDANPDPAPTSKPMRIRILLVTLMRILLLYCGSGFRILASK